MYINALTKTPKAIAKMVVKLNFLILNKAIRAAEREPSKPIKAIITRTKLMKHQSLPTVPKNKSIIFIYKIVKEIFTDFLNILYKK